MTYGKEPFDLRLTMLCMYRRLPVIFAVTLLGTVLFGGGYYVKNVLLRNQHFYTATSIYQVAYAAEEKDVGAVYINQMSWNTYLQSQMFLDAVRFHLAESVEEKAENMETDIGEIPTNEALGEMLQAFLASDLRVPSTVVTTESPEKSIWIAQAVEAAMTQEFVGEIREIASISVIDPGNKAQEVIPDVRVGRAFVLSAVLSCFFVIVAVLLQITGEDGIRLPSTIWKRYGVRTVGTIESKELGENLRYFFGGEHVKGNFLKRVAVCSVQEQVDATEVLERLRQICPEMMGVPEEDAGEESGKNGWFAVPAPLQHPESTKKLRSAEGILLVVRAGAHGGRQFERVLEYLQQQDCKVTAAILWEADEKLIRLYYVCGTNKRKGGCGCGYRC